MDSEQTCRPWDFFHGKMPPFFHPNPMGFINDWLNGIFQINGGIFHGIFMGLSQMSIHFMISFPMENLAQSPDISAKARWSEWFADEVTICQERHVNAIRLTVTKKPKICHKQHLNMAMSPSETEKLLLLSPGNCP